MSSTTPTSSGAPPAVQVSAPHPSLETNDPSVKAMWNSKKHVILQEEQFNHHLSNTFFNAWRKYTFENHLYGVYGLVAFLTSTVTESQYPVATLIPTPQALFHRPTTAASDSRDRDADTHASDWDEADSDSESVPRTPEEPVATFPPESSLGEEESSSEEESSEKAESSDSATASDAFQVKASTGRLSKEDRRRIPDFARIIAPNRAPSSPEHIASRDDLFVDFWEIKRLAMPQQWHTRKARREAQIGIRRHIEQVYDTAMEAFKCNPSWNRVTALLIIGCYFSQFEWVRQPQSSTTAQQGSRSESGRPPVTPTPGNPPPNPPPAPPTPVTPLDVDPSLSSAIARENTKELIASQEERLAELKRRITPTVYYLNQKAFVMEKDKTYGTRCSLSPAFIEALARPLHAEDLVQNVTAQPSWLDVVWENREPNADAQTYVERLLHKRQIKETKVLIDWLKGVKKPEDAKTRIPATPQTDPKDTNYPAQARRGGGRARDGTPTPIKPKLDSVGQRTRKMAIARGDTPQANEGSLKLKEDRKKKEEEERKKLASIIE
ncbi:hypothetical protein C8Q74DRAFT_1234931 [Fomes fomentarius]|nr:hypothetical protein C8Q74DRAFT_1234931 [Fomes fomentarius]